MSETSPLRIWVLISYRAGMNSQILGLAEALGCPWESQRLAYRPGWAGWWPAYLGARTLAGIDRSASSPVGPPWPDLVITAGRRHEPVCRWIRARSGGRSRLVFLGRTWAPSPWFDLVVTTPQYRLSPGPRVLENPTTLHRVTDARLGEAAERWAPRLADRPRPRIAVLVGGTSEPYALGPIAARRLAARVTALAAEQGGSLMVTTSSRTDPSVREILATTLPESAWLYRYRPDDPENPYFGLLALADQVVVTADSIAMVSEAVATRKPVFLFDLATGRRSMRRRAGSPEPAGRGVTGVGNDFDWGCTLSRWKTTLGPRWLGRDVTRVHRRLVDSGKAVWLGDPWPEPLTTYEGPVSVDRSVIDDTVRRVLGLVP